MLGYRLPTRRRPCGREAMLAVDEGVPAGRSRRADLDDGRDGAFGPVRRIVHDRLAMTSVLLPPPSRLMALARP